MFAFVFGVPELLFLFCFFPAVVGLVILLIYVARSGYPPKNSDRFAPNSQERGIGEPDDKSSRKESRSARQVVGSGPGGSPMTTEWFYARDGHQYGPFLPDELRRMAGDRGLRPDDLVWR